MTEYRVGECYRIGDAVGEVTRGNGNPIGFKWITCKLPTPFYSEIPLDVLRLMGAVLVPEPIEWKDGDCIAAIDKRIGTLAMRQDDNAWLIFRTGSETVSWGTDEWATEKMQERNSVWKRVAVTPYD